MHLIPVPKMPLKWKFHIYINIYTDLELQTKCIAQSNFENIYYAYIYTYIFIGALCYLF